MLDNIFSKKNWVKFSNENSIKESKYSVLAIIEIIICSFVAINYNQTALQILINLFKFILNLFLGKLAFVQNISWDYLSNIPYLFFLVPLVPLTLMRSSESVIHGQKLLKNYWTAISFFEIPANIELILATSASIVSCLFIVLFYDFFINSMSDNYWLIYKSACISVLLTFVSTVLVFSFYKFYLKFAAKSLAAMLIKLIPTICLIEFCSSLQLFYHTKNINLVVLHVILLFTLFLMLIYSRKGDLGYPENQHKNVNSMSAFPDANPVSATFVIPYLFGLAVRLLFIRLYSSIIYWREGVRNIQKNWRVLNFSTDSFTTSSLMPKAEEVSFKLTTDGLIDYFKRGYRKDDYLNRKNDITKFGTFLFDKLILLQGIVSYFLVANCYRWALKSTFWAWWLISLNYKIKFLEPRIRDNRTKTTIGWASNPIFVTIFIYSIVFIVIFFTKNGTIKDWITKLIPNVSTIDIIFKEQIVSNFHLLATFWITIFVPMVCLFLYLQAIKTNSLFKKDLEDRKIDELLPADKLLYDSNSEFLELLRGAFWFSLWQSIWWIVLAIVLLPYWSRLSLI